MNTNELRKWAEENSIENKTIDGFWSKFHSYKNEQEKEFYEVFRCGFSNNQLRINMDRLALIIDNWNKDSFFPYGFDYVMSYLPIVYKDKKIGEYRVLFDFDGEIFDDYFIIY